MAIANPTVLGTPATDTATATSITSGSVTPSSGALILVVGATRDVTLGTISMSTTLSNVGSWTTYSSPGPGGNDGDIVIAVAKITGSAGSGTVTMDFGVSCQRHAIAVCEIATGYATSSSVVQSKSGNTTGTSFSYSLDSTPVSTSLVFAAIAGRGATDITAGSGFTELTEVNNGTGNPVIHIQYKNGSANTTIDWSTLGSNGKGAYALEIAASSAAVSGFFSLMRS